MRRSLLRLDPAQRGRLENVRDNLGARIAEAEREGRPREVAGIETTVAAAAQKLETAPEGATQPPTVHPGMPAVRRDTGRRSADVGRSFASDPQLRG